jgi:hypothetical protein
MRKTSLKKADRFFLLMEYLHSAGLSTGFLPKDSDETAFSV